MNDYIKIENNSENIAWIIFLVTSYNKNDNDNSNDNNKSDLSWGIFGDTVLSWGFGNGSVRKLKTK